MRGHQKYLIYKPSSRGGGSRLLGKNSYAILRHVFLVSTGCQDGDQLAEPVVAAEGAADGPPDCLHVEAAVRTRVVAAWGLPSRRVGLEADGALDALGGRGRVTQTKGKMGERNGGGLTLFATFAVRNGGGA